MVVECPPQESIENIMVVHIVKLYLVNGEQCVLSLVYYQKISVGPYDYFGTVLQIFFRVRPGPTQPLP